MADATTTTDVIIIGAGAAGLMCAISAGKRGRRGAADRPCGEGGKKILISGGGRCNFTNLDTVPDRFISANRHFCISALRRYTQHDFTALVRRHGIPFHEKKLGQLFCDDSARDIVGMLLRECDEAGVTLMLETTVSRISKDNRFRVETQRGSFEAGKSGDRDRWSVDPEDGRHRVRLPGRGAIRPDRPADPRRPCPLHLRRRRSTKLQGSGRRGVRRRGPLQRRILQRGVLFTHRGISGPAILQISSYWRDGMPVEIDMLPGPGVESHLRRLVAERPKAEVKTLLSDLLPRRLAQGVNSSRIRRPSRRPGAGAGMAIADRRSAPLGDLTGRDRGLPYRGGHSGRRRYRRFVVQDDGSPQCAGTLFHRRGGGCDRLARRL